MALDLDFFKDIGKSAKAIGTGVVDFFRSPSMDTVKDIGSAVVSVGSAIRSAGSDFRATPPTGLADPNVNLGQFKVRGTSRSRAGVSSFGDIGEASFYKYAQLQNTVRYLYNQKARYKTIAKTGK
jgi:hypothetical protein|tara:strand:- start:1100 stop:1474 length:375 start_codon:yes stop_codon:yes gene_type:complete